MERLNPDEFQPLDEDLNDLLDQGLIEMILGEKGEILYQLTKKGFKRTEIVCDLCHGDKWVDDNYGDPHPCPRCNGTGIKFKV